MSEKKGKGDKSAARGGERPVRRRAGANSANDGQLRAERPQKNKIRDKTRLAPVERTTAFEGERIAKIMARAGVCSRRDAEKWIAEGRVAVNGRVLQGPAVNVKKDDRIEIDGAPMAARERTRLFLFHKPAGYVTTAHDPEGRATVFALLRERFPEAPRLVSVGRLDINTEGLLLLTNDGGLARALELPATGWTRRYRVRAHGGVDQARLDELSAGVTIEGMAYAPIEAKIERAQGSNVWIAMSLTEGKNREIKRVLAHLGLEVTRLIRVSYGPFQLGELAEGALEEVRLKVLREQLGKQLAAFAGVDFAAPLREATPAEQQERRERTEKKPRKHVSRMRHERAENREKGPRARVTRGVTADRKGRAVAVERIKPAQPARETNDAATMSRNQRRFAAMRREDAPHDAAARAPRHGYERHAASDVKPRAYSPKRHAPKSDATARERRSSTRNEAGRADFKRRDERARSQTRERNRHDDIRDRYLDARRHEPRGAPRKSAGPGKAPRSGKDFREGPRGAPRKGPHRRPRVR